MKSSYCASTGNCLDVEFHKSSYSNGASACVEIGVFAKSSFSGGNGNCVEVGATVESSYCANNGCVEVTGDSDGVNYEIVVRDTKQNGTGPTLHYTPAEWLAFIKGVKDGEFDLTPELTAAAEAELANA